MARNTKPASPAPEDAPFEAADGYAVLRAPEGAGNVSFDGEEYEVDQGFVHVPSEAVADLLAHGFSTK